MSPSHPQQKLVKKNTRVTGKIILAHFWGQLGGKKNGIVTNLKLSELMSYPNSQIMESCCFGKKELPNLALSVYLSVL